MLCKISPTKIRIVKLEKNVNKIAKNSSAFDYAKEAFKALDDGPG